MRVVEEKIGRYNGWNLRELRVERAAETASPDERETAALSELGAAREVEPTDEKEAAEAAEVQAKARAEQDAADARLKAELEAVAKARAAAKAEADAAEELELQERRRVLEAEHELQQFEAQRRPVERRRERRELCQRPDQLRAQAEEYMDPAAQEMKQGMLRKSFMPFRDTKEYSLIPQTMET